MTKDCKESWIMIQKPQNSSDHYKNLVTSFIYARRCTKFCRNLFI